MTQKQQNNSNASGSVDFRRRYRPYLMAVVLAFVLTLIAAPEVNEGRAMEPALKDGQVLAVLKDSYSAKRGAPKPGEIIVMDKTFARDICPDNLIGRVAGLPGDTVEIKDGKVYRNGREFRPQDSGADAGKDQTVKIGKDDVFLLADGRGGSLDSRSPKLGPVPMRSIKGNVRLKIWPLSDFGGVRK